MVHINLVNLLFDCAAALKGIVESLLQFIVTNLLKHETLVCHLLSYALYDFISILVLVLVSIHERFIKHSHLLVLINSNNFFYNKLVWDLSGTLFCCPYLCEISFPKILGGLVQLVFCLHRAPWFVVFV